MLARLRRRGNQGCPWAIGTSPSSRAGNSLSNVGVECHDAGVEKGEAAVSVDSAVTEAFLDHADVAPLLRALHDASPEVRLAMFEALVRLPLAPSDWAEVGAYATWVIDSRDSLAERLDVIDATPYVAVRSFRERVARLLAEGEGADRLHAALALALLGDPRSAAPLIEALGDSGKQDWDRTEGARRLALVDVSGVRDALVEKCRQARGDDPAKVMVRFWLALALARAGADAELRRLFEDLGRGAADVLELHVPPGQWAPGSPDLGPAEMAGPSLPEGTARWLTALAGSGHEFAPLAGRIVEASGPVRDLEEEGTKLAPAWAAGITVGFTHLSDSETERARERLAGLRLLDPDGMLRPEALAAVRREALEPVAVTVLFERSVIDEAAGVVSGNELVQWVGTIQREFRPDALGLCREYVRQARQAREAREDWGRSLRWQIGWAVSRGGLRGLVSELAAALAATEPYDRIEAGHLIADAADYATETYAPLFGGGEGPHGPFPVAEMVPESFGEPIAFSVGDPAARDAAAQLAGMHFPESKPVVAPVEAASQAEEAENLRMTVEADQRRRAEAEAAGQAQAERRAPMAAGSAPTAAEPPMPEAPSRGRPWWRRGFGRGDPSPAGGASPTRSWRTPTRKFDPRTGEPIGSAASPPPVGAPPAVAAPPPSAAIPPMAAPEAPPSGATTPTYRAYGLLESNETVLVGAQFDLKVGLSPSPQAGVSGTAMDVRRPEPSKAYKLDIQLFADGFDVGPGESLRNSLDVSDDRLFPTVGLHLTARDLPEATKDREITAIFSIEGQTLGTATRHILVTKDATAVALQAPAVTATGANITTPTGEPAADVTIIIKVGLRRGALLWGVESTLPGVSLSDGQPAESEIGDGNDPEDFAKEIIQKLFMAGKDLGLDELLTGIGITVQELIPIEVRNAIKAAQEAVGKRTLDVLLLTAEPYIPWELAWQADRFDPEAPNFLGAQVNIGRWILDPAGVAPTDPPRQVNASTMAVVSGIYNSPGLQRLLAAEEEAKIIKKTYHAQAIDAQPPVVYPLLKGTPPSDILHFAVHGRYNPEGADEGIYLVSGRPIDPFRILGSNLHDRSPFVFLNACQVGSSSNLLGRYGGIAQALLKIGASAVVAPLWSIDDHVAQRIALAFYKEALRPEKETADSDDDDERPTVAALLRKARAGFISDKDVHSSTYLAYQFYGHPSLRLTWKPAQRP
jgi:hypothetical protein